MNLFHPYRSVSSAALASTLVLGAIRSDAGTFTFNYSISATPTTALSNAYFMIEPFVFTPNSDFNTILAEAQGTVLTGSAGPQSLGSVTGTVTRAGSITVNSPTTSTTPNVIIFATLLANYSGGSVVGYDDVAGQKVVTSGANWPGSAIPTWRPIPSPGGTIINRGFVDETTLGTALSTNNTSDIADYSRLLAHLHDVYNQSQGPASPTPIDSISCPVFANYTVGTAYGTDFRTDQPMTSRSMKLVSYSAAADVGSASVSVVLVPEPIGLAGFTSAAAMLRRRRQPLS